MNENSSTVDKGVYSAVVSFNRQIGERFYRLGLGFSGAGAKAFAEAKPGQFAQLDLSGAALPKAEAIPEKLADASQREILLRRPFSFSDVSSKDGKAAIEILYCVLGPGSLRMTTLRPRDSISVVGPLGNGFWVPEEKKTAFLVLGGMGAGPLEHLAKVLTADYPSTTVVAFAGAKTAKELPFEKRLDDLSKELGFPLAEFAKYGIESVIATDDGSAGFGGLVTDCFAQWLEREQLATKDTIIYACGPEAMLGRIAGIARERKIDCQMSMERMMGCGIGVCQSCAVECKAEGADESVYKMCCTDGPVFDAKEVVFDK